MLANDVVEHCMFIIRDICMQNVDYLNLNVLIFNLEAQDGG